jgi:hypothetical protein
MPDPYRTGGARSTPADRPIGVPLHDGPARGGEAMSRIGHRDGEDPTQVGSLPVAAKSSRLATETAWSAKRS